MESVSLSGMAAAGLSVRHPRLASVPNALVRGQEQAGSSQPTQLRVKVYLTAVRVPLALYCSLMSM